MQCSIRAVDWRLGVVTGARNLRRSPTFASLIEDQARQAKADFQVVLPMNVGVHEVTIVFGPPRAMPSVTGAAYSADEVLEYTKTLPDGTHTTQSSVIGHLFRDSQGRTRVKQVWKAAAG
jgi:hypothetical protein